MATHRVRISTDAAGNVVNISPTPLKVRSGDQVVLAYEPETRGATSSLTVKMSEDLFCAQADGNQVVREVKIPMNGTMEVFITPRARPGSFMYEINRQRSTTPDIIVDDD